MPIEKIATRIGWSLEAHAICVPSTLISRLITKKSISSSSVSRIGKQNGSSKVPSTQNFDCTTKRPWLSVARNPINSPNERYIPYSELVRGQRDRVPLVRYAGVMVARGACRSPERANERHCAEFGHWIELMSGLAGIRNQFCTLVSPFNIHEGAEVPGRVRTVRTRTMKRLEDRKPSLEDREVERETMCVSVQFRT